MFSITPEAIKVDKLEESPHFHTPEKDLGMLNEGGETPSAH